MEYKHGPQKKHWNVSAVGVGGRGQPEAKAGGIHQNHRADVCSTNLSKQETGSATIRIVALLVLG